MNDRVKQVNLTQSRIKTQENLLQSFEKGGSRCHSSAAFAVEECIKDLSIGITSDHSQSLNDEYLISQLSFRANQDQNRTSQNSIDLLRKNARDSINSQISLLKNENGLTPNSSQTGWRPSKQKLQNGFRIKKNSYLFQQPSHHIQQLIPSNAPKMQTQQLLQYLQQQQQQQQNHQQQCSPYIYQVPTPILMRRQTQSLKNKEQKEPEKIINGLCIDNRTTSLNRTEQPLLIQNGILQKQSFESNKLQQAEYFLPSSNMGKPNCGGRKLIMQIQQQLNETQQSKKKEYNLRLDQSLNMQLLKDNKNNQKSNNEVESHSSFVLEQETFLKVIQSINQQSFSEISKKGKNSCSTEAESESSQLREDDLFLSKHISKHDTESKFSEDINYCKEESDKTYQLINELKCTELRNLYSKQKQNQCRRILVIHFESVLMTSSTSYFWESNQSQNFQVESGSNQSAICLYQSSCLNMKSSSTQNNQRINNQNNLQSINQMGKFRSDLKKFLKNMCKRYTTILIFQNTKRSKDLFHFLLRMNYSFDGAYQLLDNQTQQNQTLICKQQCESSLQPLVVNYNYIINDFYKANKQIVLSFTVIDSVNSDFTFSMQNKIKSINKKEYSYFFNKIPKIKINQNKIQIVLLKTRSQQPKYMDCSIIEQLISSIEKRALLQSDQIQSHVISLNLLIDHNIEYSLKQQFENNYFEEIGKIKQNIKSANYSTKNNKAEVDSDKKLETFRNLMVEYIKSFKNSDKIHHLHSLIGDLLVRNRENFKLFYKNSFYTKSTHLNILSQITQINKQGNNLNYKSNSEIRSECIEKSKNVNICHLFCLSCEIWK